MGNYQFSLRRLVYIVTFSAAIFGFFGPTLRETNAFYFWLSLVATAIQLGMLMYVAARTVRRRKTALSQAGNLISRSTSQSQKDQTDNDAATFSDYVARVVPIVILMQMGPALLLLVTVLFPPYSIIIQMVAIGLAAEAIASMYLGIDQRGIETYENGYIYHGFYFQPWDEVIDISPAIHSSNRIMVTVKDELLGGVQTVKVRTHERTKAITQMKAVLKRTRESRVRNASKDKMESAITAAA